MAWQLQKRALGSAASALLTLHRSTLIPAASGCRWFRSTAVHFKQISEAEKELEKKLEEKENKKQEEKAKLEREKAARIAAAKQKRAAEESGEEIKVEKDVESMTDEEYDKYMEEKEAEEARMMSAEEPERMHKYFPTSSDLYTARRARRILARVRFKTLRHMTRFEGMNPAPKLYWPIVGTVRSGEKGLVIEKDVPLDIPASFLEKMRRRVIKMRQLETAAAPANGAGMARQPSKYTDLFRLCGGIIVERLPSLTRELEPWETEYEEWRMKRKAEQGRSLYSWTEWLDYFASEAFRATKGGEGGGKGKKDKRPNKGEEEGIPQQLGRGDLQEVESSSKGTGIEQLNRRQLFKLAAWANYKPASRITAADVANDRKSLERKLDRKLYLIVKKNRSAHSWQFPQGGWAQGETMRETCERELKEECGSELNVYFHGEHPAGLYKYPTFAILVEQFAALQFLLLLEKYYYPEDAQEKYKAEGSKVFFYRAQFLEGTVKVNMKEGLEDYLWVTKDEMQDYFQANYYNRVRQFLFDEYETS